MYEISTTGLFEELLYSYSSIPSPDLSLSLTLRVMYSLKLTLGIALCLCWLSLPEVHSNVIPLTSDEQIEIVNAHNDHRSKVYPLVANMQKLVCNM